MGLLDDARAVLDEGPVCDSCLGRAFAALSHGLTNAERGRALRVACALDADEPFEAGGPCWVCEGECGRFDEWAARAEGALEGIAFETYQVGTRLPPLLEENEGLLREEAGVDPERGEPLKAELNREVGKRLGEALGVTVDFERPDVVALLEVDADRVSVRVNSAFVYGRYRKLVRGIPQTRWPCRECDGSGWLGGEECDNCGGSGKLYDESVEELIAPHVREAMDGTGATFHGAGREDVDARMLGIGRPFVVEVENPRRRLPDLTALGPKINAAAAGKVEVDELALATYRMVERVKELPATKTYRVEVRFDAPVDPEAFEAALEVLDGAEIAQRTPHRVAHRRADRTRTRRVFAIAGELDGEQASLDIHGEGGLYVKELVHGDAGRTQPSLAGCLGIDATVETLDVVAVEAAEGEFADPAFLRSPAG